MQENIRQIYREIEESGARFVTGLIGNPIGHSLSPFIMNSAYEILNMPENRYFLFETEKDKLKEMVEFFRLIESPDCASTSISEEKKNEWTVNCGNRALGQHSGLRLVGFNVTMPFKQEIVALCDELDEMVKITGSANVVKNTCGRLKAYNTDGKGFFNGLEDSSDKEFKSMTLLGAGGAAKAIIAEGASAGLKSINVFARKGKNFESLEAMLEKLKHLNDICTINLTDLTECSQLYESIKYSDLLVNATSAGMEDDLSAIDDFSILHDGLFVADIIYKNKTRLLAEAEKKGLKTMNGLPMLFAQADLSFEIWNGRHLPEVLKDKFY